MLKSARKDWSTEIEAQLEEKIDELLENTEDGKSLKSAQSITLQFSEGGCGVFLLFPNSILTSRLHGFLRGQLQPLIKRTREEIIRVDLNRISSGLETKTLEGIATLVSLQKITFPIMHLSPMTWFTRPMELQLKSEVADSQDGKLVTKWGTLSELGLLVSEPILIADDIALFTLARNRVGKRPIDYWVNSNGEVLKQEEAIDYRRSNVVITAKKNVFFVSGGGS